jgi:HSP90 family molecular chaperone
MTARNTFVAGNAPGAVAFIASVRLGGLSARSSSSVCRSVKARSFGMGRTSVAIQPKPVLSAHKSGRNTGLLRMSAAEATQNKETYEFQAEVSRVMDIIVNSLYSNTDIFLRELISNASDACDKKRFLKLTGKSDAGDSLSDTEELAIRVKCDEKERTISITDNGIGMTKSELINNLGKIAASGTAKFVEALKEGAADLSLIGRFGVGFYSAFLVADRVTVHTKSPNDQKAWRWESEQTKNFTITEESDPRSFLPEGATSGTTVTLHIKEGMEKYLNDFSLRQLLELYSEFVSFPIYLWMSRIEYDKVKEKDEKTGEEKEKSVPRTVYNWELVNKTKPIWMRKPSEVTDDEYNEFYKSISRDFEDPLARTHFSAEGEVEFRSILFTPRRLPFELAQNMFSEAARPLKLYVKRVFISDKFDELIPRWLTFIRGVVDSEDLPLNVSREILQQSKVARVIGRRVTRKAIDMFREIAERSNPKDYETLWENFGRYLKVGAFEDNEWSKDLRPLLRFHSSKSGDKWVSFDEYIGRMKESQNKRIFYLAAENRLAAMNSPLLERLKKKDYEVIFLLEPVDELVFQQLNGKYGDGYTLVDVAKSDLELDSEAEDSKEDNSQTQALSEAELEPLCKWLGELFKEHVEKVKVSKRLTDSPMAISQSTYGMSPMLERFMRTQAAMLKEDIPPGFEQKRIIEINPAHPVIHQMASQLRNSGEADSEAATLLYETALLQSGYNIRDYGGFARRVTKYLQSSLLNNLNTTGGGDNANANGDASSGESKAEAVEAEVVGDAANP